MISVTGYGAITCAGKTANELWQSCLDEKTHIQNGLGAITNQDFDAPLYQAFLESDKFDFITKRSRAMKMSLTAIDEAMAHAGWTELRPDDGIILATTTGQIELWDQILVDYLTQKIEFSEFTKSFRYQPIGYLLENLCQSLDFNGQRLLIASACTAATQAIGLAYLWLKEKRVKRCLVGGVEVLCPLTVEGFRSLKLLSDQTSTPFDLNRKGINLSEGSAFLCLESEPQKNQALANISGFGISTDAYHMTGPQPEGVGSLRAMQSALHNAKLSSNDISWIHAHGTGSELNDLSEGRAVIQCFGQEMPFVTSTKWIHGHALGASGVLESILCIKALQEQRILKSFGHCVQDPKIPLRLTDRTQSLKVKNVLKNTLGFGGMNASIIMSQPQ